MRRAVIACFLAMAVCAIWVARPARGDEPFFVDLTAAANRGLQDDGVADNGVGGWTDEGINDMYVYPELRFGVQSWRGTPFRLIDPAANHGRALPADAQHQPLPQGRVRAHSEGH